MIHSFFPLWTSLFVSTLFKKVSCEIIPENAINRPYILLEEIVLEEKSYAYRKEDLI